MTTASATTYGRIAVRTAVIAAELSSRLVSPLRAQLAQAPCTPAHEAADVRAYAYSLPRGESRLPAGPLPSRYLLPL